MPSFRKATNQAKHIISTHSAIGQSRHVGKINTAEMKVHSLGTARNYQQALAKVAEWLKTHKLGTLKTLTEAQAIQYLEERSESIRQKTLNQERQALQLCLNKKLPIVQSEIETVAKSRAYSSVQIAAIAKAQTTDNQLATQLAAAAGLRAHELLTIQPANVQPKSTHRYWSDSRFYGIAESGKRYTVIGKGGLIREVILPEALATKLEARKLAEPKAIQDRTIKYQQHYAIGGGKTWSNSFSKASNRVLGWSNGAHGLRHAYAQTRMDKLQQQGFLYAEALGVVSQELGHFRPEITEVYLI